MLKKLSILKLESDESARDLERRVMTLVKKAYPKADKRTAESLNVNWITNALPTEIQLRVQAKKFRTISEVVEEATYRLEVEKVRKVKKPTLAKNEVLQTANEVKSNSTSQTSEKRAAKEVSLVTLSHELKNTNKQINERISQIEKSQHPDRINQQQVVLTNSKILGRNTNSIAKRD